MLDVVATCKISRSEAESDSVPVRDAKIRGKPPKSASQTLQLSTSTRLVTQQTSESYNFRSRKNE